MEEIVYRRAGEKDIVLQVLQIINGDTHLNIMKEGYNKKSLRIVEKGNSYNYFVHYLKTQINVQNIKDYIEHLREGANPDDVYNDSNYDRLDMIVKG